MRGKTILWFALALLLVGTMMTHISMGQVTETKITIQPANINNKDFSMEYFTIDVWVSHVQDLYAFGFTLQFAPYVGVIAATEVTEGPFLSEGGSVNTAFVKTIDAFRGQIKVGATRLGNVPGAGPDPDSGTLVTIRFKVLEAGQSPLELIDTALIDSNGESIPHISESGKYVGPTVELVGMELMKRSMKIGESQTFTPKIKNTGDIPLYAKVRFDNIRVEDGEKVTMWAGQQYAFPPKREPVDLYVDGYDYTREYWTEVGAYPWLDAEEDGNYLEGTFDGAQHRWFTFQDIALEGAVVDYVQLWGYTDGPYNEGVDYDIYTGNFDWLGSLYATGGPAWVTPRWVGPLKTSDIDPSLLTEEGINNLKVLVYYYDPGGFNATQTDILDALKIHVEFKAGKAPEYSYVDGYDYTREYWTEVGAYPWLDAEEDGNYLEGTFDGAQHRWFTFQDVDTGGAAIDYVQLWGYTDGPYNEGVDYDIYTGNFDWLGSLYATGGPAWVTPRWVGPLKTSDIDPSLLTEEGINNLKVLVYYYDPGGFNATQTDILDALKLEIVFKAERAITPPAAPVFIIQPHEELRIDPALWELIDLDTGTYAVTATVLFSYNQFHWNEGIRQQTRSWWLRG